MTQRRRAKKRSKSKSPLQPELNALKKVKAISDPISGIELDTILDDSECESRCSISSVAGPETDAEMDSENTVVKAVNVVCSTAGTVSTTSSAASTASTAISSSVTVTSVTVTITNVPNTSSISSVSSVSSLSSTTGLNPSIPAPSPPPQMPHPSVMPPGMVGNFTPVARHGSPPSPMGYYQGAMMSYPGHLGPPISDSPIMPYPGMAPSLSLSISDDDVTRIALKLKSILSTEIESLVKQKVAEEMAPLKEEILELRKFRSETINEVVSLKMKVDDQEQYSRRMCIRVTGINETNGEDTNKLVLDLATQMSVPLKPDDIDRSHRVGNARVGRNQRSRELIVKFTNYTSRLNFIKGRKRLRELGTNVYISEDLTKLRKNIYYECRQLVKAKVIKTTFSVDGNIFVIDNNDKKTRVRSTLDLVQFQPQPGHVGSEGMTS